MNDCIVKICSKCNCEKLLEEFSANKNGLHGKHSVCKACVRMKSKQHYLLNKEKYAAKQKVYLEKNRDRQLKVQAAWRLKNRSKLAEDGKVYYLNNKEIIREKAKEYNKGYRGRQNLLYNERYISDPHFRISKNMSRYMHIALSQRKHGRNWEKFVGYTLSDLIEHLEAKFQDGMNWENYGQWHLDHVLPVSSFHYVSITEESFKRCWCLQNLQPLWAADNMAKGNRLVGGKL